MKRAMIFFTVVLVIAELNAQQKGVTVFESGMEGHKSYRIPAIISLPNGDILAFAEGRKNNASDFGDINIVQKRSKDKGKTWTELQTIVDYAALQAGNPAPVVDLTDPKYPAGRVFLFYNTGNNHEGEVRKGKGLREVWYITSSDGGQTWSEAVNITLQVHRPNQPAVNRAYQFSEDWRSYANTPGHAMQFQEGTYRGRIFVAANHSAGEPKKQAEDYDAHGFYTDDHGTTFQLGSDLKVPGSNESIAAELGMGKLMMNSRNQKGHIRTRIVSVSSDGGQTWDTSYYDHQLPDPVCQGTLLNIGKKKGKNILAFCNAADEKKRDNLTLRISFDEGQSWPKSYLIDRAELLKDNTAYSDIIKVSKREIGVLYEKNNYSKILFTTVKWK
ncbi:MAG TPA: sialidase family protein [Chitinophagaceae bacterium]|jgi:sialidase-1|nr:sialidase family protein [Chitinophagaceae bacterium]HRG91309.1 sialidase family protein [Chitinophagaceae bacterium]